MCPHAQGHFHLEVGLNSAGNIHKHACNPYAIWMVGAHEWAESVHTSEFESNFMT
jgi:hypothetical protein